jgi:hypothetical protein
MNQIRSVLLERGHIVPQSKAKLAARLCWSEAQSSARGPAGRVGNRQAHRQRGRLQGRTSAMGDRTNVVLTPTQSTFDGSLRSLRPHRRRLRQGRNDMCHAQADR